MKKTIKGKVYITPTVIPVIFEYDDTLPMSSVANSWEGFARKVVSDNLNNLFGGFEVKFED